MMYGQVGVVGTYDATRARFFDASDPTGVALYQDWIVRQTRPYRELTTTVHANSANRELRNAFRTRFQIDCVYFHPDQECPDYVDTAADWWLAITHWDAYRVVGHGFSSAVIGLKWCVVSPDAFKEEEGAYAAFLYKTQTASCAYLHGTYGTLRTDIQKAYAASTRTVVISDFS